MTKKTNRTKKINTATKEYKKKQETLRQIQEGREKHDASRKRKIPGFGIGIRATHKDHGSGVIIRESMHYFHRVDLELDKPVMLGGSLCRVVHVWPGHLTLIETQSKKEKNSGKQKQVKKRRSD